MKLVIGLGNPGDRYMNNRKNIGFKVIDVIANNINIRIKTKKKKSLLGKGVFEGKEIVLLKPQTFMDLSGEAVLYIASFLKIPVRDIIVMHDDYLIPLGQVKITRGPLEISNIGLESIIKGLKSDKFIRIRVGVGPDSKEKKQLSEKEIEKYLSQDFSLTENVYIIDIVNHSEAALRSILTQDIADVLSRYKLNSSPL